MTAARTLLEDLALVLCVAAVTTVLFRRLRQPAVLGYLLAGFIVGPHLPIPLFADMARVHTLSELGVIFVMFSVGLEFSIRRLLRVIPTSGIIGVVQIGTMMSLGYATGRAFGWSARQSLFMGAMVSISSTMIVAKVFAEQRVSTRLSETVFGVLVVQDLAAVLLLAMLTAVSTGKGLAGAVLAKTAGQLAGFLLAIVVVGFLVVPRTIRAVERLKSPETLLLTSIGVCFALALIAHRVGFSIALGAFLAGSLIAESGVAEQIEKLIHPIREVFAAIFFVAVGMILDPKVLLEHWAVTAILIAVVIVGQIVSISVGAFLAGRDLRTSIQAGMSLAQIGEFSFIIASAGVASGAIEPFLYPVAVAVAVVTTFTTPWLVRLSGPVTTYVDRRLPRPLQTFVALYGTWLDDVRANRDRAPSRDRRLLRLLAIDVGVLAGLLVGASFGRERLASVLEEKVGIAARTSSLLVLVAALLAAAPFVLGIARISRTLGLRVIEAALPSAAPGKLDLAAAPRRVLIVTAQLVIVLVVGLPLLVLTEPFISTRYSVLALLVLGGALAVSFWRGATNLHDHVKAGTEMIVEVLGKQSSEAKPSLDEVNRLLPGLGSLTPLKLTAKSPAIGRTLIEIDLRAQSGASVITILRDGAGIDPTGREPLLVADILVLAGTHEAIETAGAMLSAPGEDVVL